MGGRYPIAIVSEETHEIMGVPMSPERSDNPDHGPENGMELDIDDY